LLVGMSPNLRISSGSSAAGLVRAIAS
jgi:hypothetical protein